MRRTCTEDVMSSYSQNTKTPLFSNSSGLKSVFEMQKLRFRDGMVWTVGLTVEIQLHFQMFPSQCERGVLQGKDIMSITETKFRSPSPLHVHLVCFCLRVEVLAAKIPQS